MCSRRAAGIVAQHARAAKQAARVIAGASYVVGGDERGTRALDRSGSTC
jgi:hypothetical protein